MNDPRPSHAPVTVGIVSKHHLVRIGLQAALTSQPHIQLVGEATGALDAEKLVARAHPRVLVIADGSGTLYEPRGLDEVTVLIGPEGGWTPRELEAARSKGVRIASFGPHVMRIETAAVVAVSVILAAEQGLRGRQSHPEG